MIERGGKGVRQREKKKNGKREREGLKGRMRGVRE